ncbi:MAG TPA: YigZ family protein [Paludibacteraceae bacterium]|nr:YigZ family protein [Paludibacteraceae bacterium]HPT42449.1 YigZ family protein [Paludibacteraceae bacterium]
MAESFRSITHLSQGIYKEKGSKFLSFAIPVKNVVEIKSILDIYRKKYYDARHVCYAYMLGADRSEFRANDDGEPSGTAGRPILGQINSSELTDILVIVVRYFGGILLGTSGLITAYKEAAADAIGQANIVEITVKNELNIRFEYPLLNDVMRIIKEYDVQIINQQFEEQCSIKISVPKKVTELISIKLEHIFGVNVEK